MAILGILRTFPTAFATRLAIAFVEIVLAVTVLSGSVVLGHDLKEWRAWYYDPATEHPWAPTPRPTPAPEVDASL
jgi:hypothetical protein